jgi:hypothetical protein
VFESIDLVLESINFLFENINFPGPFLKQHLSTHHRTLLRLHTFLRREQILLHLARLKTGTGGKLQRVFLVLRTPACVCAVAC